MIRKKILICSIFISAIMMLMSGSAFAIATVGTSIESQAEVYHEAGYTSSEVTITFVDQMYGVTIEPTNISNYDVPGVTHYFPHIIHNLGNGSDGVKFHFEIATPASWEFTLINDDDMNGTHEVTEVTTLENPVIMSEEGLRYFFVAVTIPTGEASGTTGIAKIAATSEVFDGGYYIGADSTIYGGPDIAEATDILTIEALYNLLIHRDDVTGDIYLTWDGGNGDVYYIEGTYEADFSGALVEAYDVPSHFITTIEAQDGNIRYYRVALAGTTTFDERTVGKFDIDTNIGFTFTSNPFVYTAVASADIDIIIGNQLTAGDLPANSDRVYSYRPYGFFAIQGVTWQQSFLRTDLGWTGTLQYFGPDVGSWVNILSGHSAGKLTYVGIVSDVASREIDLNQGFNMIGTAYPVEVDLDDTDLDGALTAGELPADSDKIYTYENGRWYQAFLKEGVGWIGTLEKLSPGKAYWVTKQGVAATWQYPRPY
ncbi:hypothetical protein ACFLZ2_01010 [Candidatus Margulisiibacteriota bacterium]